MKYTDTVIQVFAKAPVPGEVNTRLLPHIGIEAATALQEQLIRQRLAGLVDADLCSLQLWCLPDTTHEFFAACQRQYQVSLFAQNGADLGVRMSNAIRRGLEMYSRVILIGSDAPSLDVDRIEQAITVLTDNEIVIVPAEDGGYVLIGMRRHYPAVFESVSWGSDSVMAQTRKHIDSLGVSAVELDACWDIDRIADYERYLELER